jgi:hypothetical protein
LLWYVAASKCPDGHGSQQVPRWARGAVVPHPLSTREAVGSITSVSMYDRVR